MKSLVRPIGSIFSVQGKLLKVVKPIYVVGTFSKCGDCYYHGNGCIHPNDRINIAGACTPAPSVSNCARDDGEEVIFKILGGKNVL